MKKRVCSIILSLTLVVGLLIGLQIPVNASGNSDYGYYLLEDGTVKITDYYGMENVVNIPSKIEGHWVSIIGYDAFYNSQMLTSVTIPSSVSLIENYAFDDCDNLLSVKILNPYCAIGYNAFGYYCAPVGMTIYADAGSTAENFAQILGINFVIYDTHNKTTQTIQKATTSKDGAIIKRCDYCGQETRTTISKIGKITLSKTSYTYDGNEKKPGVSVKDGSGKVISSSNYTVTYAKGRKKAGKYTVTVTFKNNYSGTVKKTFEIKAKTIKASKIYIENRTYTGKKIEPKVWYQGTKLKKGKDYSIKKISGNKKIGTAKVTLKFKGNYKGTIKKTYKIIPAAVKGIKLKSRNTTSITVKWKKVKGVQGYKIYRWNSKKGKYKLYKTLTSTAATVKSAASADKIVDIYIVAYKKVGKKTYESYGSFYYNALKPKTLKYTANCSDFGKIRINFKGIKNYKNVQVQMCINKSFDEDRYAVRNFYNSVSNYSFNPYIEIYNLTSNKTYYIRCREYVYDRDGKLLNSAWGSVKKIYVQ